jgi:hypothetical protein
MNILDLIFENVLFFACQKYFNSLMRIRIRDSGSCQPWIRDPGGKNRIRSGIDIPDPQHSIVALSVADPNPGSSAFLTPGPGSGIRNRFFPDPGSRIPTPYFLELSEHFLGKN